MPYTLSDELLFFFCSGVLTVVNSRTKDEYEIIDEKYIKTLYEVLVGSRISEENILKELIDSSIVIDKNSKYHGKFKNSCFDPVSALYNELASVNVYEYEKSHFDGDCKKQAELQVRLAPPLDEPIDRTKNSNTYSKSDIIKLIAPDIVRLKYTNL